MPRGRVRADATERERLQLLTAVSGALFSERLREVFSVPVLLGGLRRVVDGAIAAHAADRALRPVAPVLLMRVLVLTVQAHAATRAGLAELLTLLLRRCGASVFEAAAPAAGAPVWEGFVMLVKGLVPLSLPLAALLDEPLLAALVAREANLAQRLRTWAAALAPQAREALPEHVRRLLA